MREEERQDFYLYNASENARAGLLHLVAAGDTVYEPGDGVDRRSFDSFLLAIVESGRFRAECPSLRAEALPGDVALLDCYQPHRYWALERCRVLWVHFDGAPARAYYDWVRRTNGTVFSHPDAPRARASLRAVLENLRGGAVDELQCALRLTEALTLLAAPAGENGSGAGYAEAIEELLAYINANLDADLSGETLARRMRVTEPHFVRVFREAVGVTPRQYVIAARLSAANYLLATGEMSVREVARAVGYSSETMFTAAFKKRLGMTPSQYRSEVCGAKRS